MDIKTKARIVGEAWLSTRGIEQWASAHHYLDIGFPLSFAVAHDYVTPKRKANEIIEESYNVLAAALSIDPNKDYQSFEDMLDENIMLQVEKES